MSKKFFSTSALAELTAKRLSRRSFFGRTAAAGGAALAVAAFPHQASAATTATPGDVAILKFLAAAELLEADLWQQYCELARDNPLFRSYLIKIDPTLPDYVCGDFYDELSHAEFINAYLESIGEEPVDLDAFRTLPSAPVKGALDIGRLTNLTDLTVDTSYYNRYRGNFNPDFQTTAPQKATLSGVAAVPTSSTKTPGQFMITAQVATFHFGSIEQGGSSLYNNLIQNVTSLDAVSILGSIGPTEVYHLALFFSSLEGIFGFTGKQVPGGAPVTFPSIRTDPTKGQNTPHPTQFLDASYPLCSVIRPTAKAQAGAMATVNFLAASGLFMGQPQAFVDAAVNLATAADAVGRNGANPV